MAVKSDPRSRGPWSKLSTAKPYGFGGKSALRSASLTLRSHRGPLQTFRTTDMRLTERLLENEYVRLEPLREPHREPLREAANADQEIWTSLYPFSMAETTAATSIACGRMHHRVKDIRERYDQQHRAIQFDGSSRRAGCWTHCQHRGPRLANAALRDRQIDVRLSDTKRSRGRGERGGQAPPGWAMR